MRLWCVSVLLGVLILSSACGGGGGATTPTGPLSGNWQIALARHVNPPPPLIFTGSLLQSGNSVTGSLILGSGCAGVGPVAGTVSGQNVSLTINEFGQDISLTGTLPSGTAPMGGAFQSLAGACAAFANTGTWTAVQVTPIAGSFHGTFTSAQGNGPFDVKGTLNQGPNTGSSTETLSGSITATGTARFCSYLSTATITGLISGTTVTLNLYGRDGSLLTQIGQLPNPSNTNASTPLVTVTPDATSLSGPYPASTSCADTGTFNLTFP